MNAVLPVNAASRLDSPASMTVVSVSRRWALGLLVALVALSGPGAQAQAALDLAGRALVRSAEAPAGARRAAAPALYPDLDVVARPDGEASVGLLVRLDRPASVAAVEAAGLAVTTLAGDVAVGRAPAAALRRIAEAPGVVSVEVGRRRLLRRRNEEARADTGVDEVYAGTGLPQPYTGAGVVVGVIDTGIDFDHPAFVNEDGSTRVARVLEFLEDGATQEWTADDINGDPGAVTQQDLDGHGTHVSGTAAGGANAGNGPHRGVAPEADLVMVNISGAGEDEEGFYAADGFLIQGVAYILDYAQSVGRPAVINMSLGGHQSPHDGSSNAARALDNLAGPGRLLVAAAGNEGTFEMHAGFEAEPGTIYEATFAAAVSPDAEAGSPIGIIGRANADVLGGVSVQLYAFDAGEVGALVATTGLIEADVDAEGEAFVPLMTEAGEEVGVLLFEYGRDPNTNAPVFSAVVIETDEDEGYSIDEGYVFGLALAAQEAGRVDMWLPFGDQGIQAFLGVASGETEVGTFTPVYGDPLFTVGYPAEARRVISVGAYNTRNAWTDIDGNMQTQNDEDGEPVALGARADFSSYGPTADGRAGVDILAPGNIVASAHSLDSEVDPTVRGRLLGGGLHILLEGTSMASPHVAGIAALMLQADPTLDPERALEILQATARQDAFTDAYDVFGPLPNAAVGAGKVDAYAAMQAVLQAVGVDDATAGAGLVLDAPFPNPTAGGATVSFSVPAAGPVRVAVYDVLGRAAAVLADGPLAAGPHRATLPAGRLAAGTYLVRVEAAGDVAVRSLVVVR